MLPRRSSLPWGSLTMTLTHPNKLICGIWLQRSVGLGILPNGSHILHLTHRQIEPCRQPRWPAEDAPTWTASLRHPSVHTLNGTQNTHPSLPRHYGSHALLPHSPFQITTRVSSWFGLTSYPLAKKTAGLRLLSPPIALFYYFPGPLKRTSFLF